VPLGPDAEGPDSSLDKKNGIFKARNSLKRRIQSGGGGERSRGLLKFQRRVVVQEADRAGVKIKGGLLRNAKWFPRQTAME